MIGTEADRYAWLCMIYNHQVQYLGPHRAFQQVSCAFLIVKSGRNGFKGDWRWKGRKVM